MPTSATCPSGHKINASEKYAGKTVKCSKCSEPIQIPTMKVEEEVIAYLGQAQMLQALFPASMGMLERVADVRTRLPILQHNNRWLIQLLLTIRR